MTIRDQCKLYRLDPLEKLQDNRLACFKSIKINQADPKHAVYELMYNENISQYSDAENGIFTGFGVSNMN